MLLSVNKLYGIDESAFAGRDPSLKSTDIAAVRAIAQAACEVELFTIPLYMASFIRSKECTRSPLPATISMRGGDGPGRRRPPPPRPTYEKHCFNIIFSRLHRGDV